jgi:hypothetical protein
LQQPEELKDILERLSPQEFDQKTERSTTFEIGCALKRYLQYLDEHQKNLDQLKTEENKKRIDLVLSGNLDDEVLTAKMDLNIDICNEILFKDVYSAEKDSECDFSDVIQSQDWKNNQCTMWLKQGKLNSQLDVATYKFGTTLYCFEKRQKEILKLLNQ